MSTIEKPKKRDPNKSRKIIVTTIVYIFLAFILLAGFTSDKMIPFIPNQSVYTPLFYWIFLGAVGVIYLLIIKYWKTVKQLFNKRFEQKQTKVWKRNGYTVGLY